jgi:hypothetical protein
MFDCLIDNYFLYSKLSCYYIMINFVKIFHIIIDFKFNPINVFQDDPNRKSIEKRFFLRTF